MTCEQCAKEDTTFREGRCHIIGAARPLPKDHKPNRHYRLAAEKVKDLKQQTS